MAYITFNAAPWYTGIFSLLLLTLWPYHNMKEIRKLNMNKKSLAPYVNKLYRYSELNASIKCFTFSFHFRFLNFMHSRICIFVVLVVIVLLHIVYSYNMHKYTHTHYLYIIITYCKSSSSSTSSYAFEFNFKKKFKLFYIKMSRKPHKRFCSKATFMHCS